MKSRRRIFAAISEVLSVGGEISGETAQRLDRIAQLFGLDEGATKGASTRSIQRRRLRNTFQEQGFGDERANSKIDRRTVSHEI